MDCLSRKPGKDAGKQAGREAGGTCHCTLRLPCSCKSETADKLPPKLPSLNIYMLRARLVCWQPPLACRSCRAPATPGASPSRTAALSTAAASGLSATALRSSSEKPPRRSSRSPCGMRCPGGAGAEAGVVVRQDGWAAGVLGKEAVGSAAQDAERQADLQRAAVQP